MPQAKQPAAFSRKYKLLIPCGGNSCQTLIKCGLLDLDKPFKAHHLQLADIPIPITFDADVVNGKAGDIFTYKGLNRYFQVNPARPRLLR